MVTFASRDDIVDRAAVLLHDPEFDFWDQDDLRGWTDDAVNHIYFALPWRVLFMQYAKRSGIQAAEAGGDSLFVKPWDCRLITGVQRARSWNITGDVAQEYIPCRELSPGALPFIESSRSKLVRATADDPIFSYSHDSTETEIIASEVCVDPFGTVTDINLGASASATDDDAYIGKWIAKTAGLGSGEEGYCKLYDASATKLATITGTWSVSDGTTFYKVVDKPGERIKVLPESPATNDASEDFVDYLLVDYLRFPDHRVDDGDPIDLPKGYIRTASKFVAAQGKKQEREFGQSKQFLQEMMMEIATINGRLSRGGR